jgi:hypothetical protein
MQQCSWRDGAVSEAVGFLLIFTMVIVGIGLVTLYGYLMLIQQQTSADEKIMEKNMIVLQNDLKSLVYKAVPYKETSLKIGGGALAVYNSSTLPAIASIDVYDAGTTYVSNFRSGDLRYESVNAQTDISLQNGAVVMRRLDDPGSVMLAKPRWFYDSLANTFVISLVSINSTEFLAREGVGTVRMRLGEATYNEYSIPAGTSVYLKYTPDTTGSQAYSIAWEGYFTITMNMVKTANPNEYLLPFDAAKPGWLVIKRYDVEIPGI